MTDPMQPIKDRSVHGDTYIENLPGWHRIILDLDAKLAAIVPDYKVLQVKEKFGGLRYYIDWHQDQNPVLRGLIDEAERASFRTCEYCGEPGELRPGTTSSKYRFWSKTLCDTHASPYVLPGGTDA